MLKRQERHRRTQNSIIQIRSTQQRIWCTTSITKKNEKKLIHVNDNEKKSKPKQWKTITLYKNKYFNWGIEKKKKKKLHYFIGDGEEKRKIEQQKIKFVGWLDDCLTCQQLKGEQMENMY